MTFLSYAPLAPLDGALDGEPLGATFFCGALRGFQAIDMIRRGAAMTESYNMHLDKNPANYAPLSPLSFLAKAAYTYPQRVATVHGQERWTWAQVYSRCRRLASSSRATESGRATRSLPCFRTSRRCSSLHFGPAMIGAVLNTLNTRLDAEGHRVHAGARRGQGAFYGPGIFSVVDKALKMLAEASARGRRGRPALQGGDSFGMASYESFLEEGDENFEWSLPADEWDAITLNYTSGTTGNPKGVVYHHRGAYLNAVSNILSWDMGRHPVYLWTLPMFHLQRLVLPLDHRGIAGTNVCLRKVDVKLIFDLIRSTKSPLLRSAHRPQFPDHRTDESGHCAPKVSCYIAGAAPPVAVIEEWSAWGSTSPTSMVSPKHTARRPSARSTRNGTGCPSRNAPASTAARAWRIRWRKG